MSVSPIGRRAWAEMGGAASDLERVRETDPPIGLHARVDVNALLGDSVALATLALQEFDERRNGLSPTSPVERSGGRIRSSAQSERYLAIDGQAPEIWSPFSGFWRVADGWVRTHGNYPHHAERLARLLGLEADAPRAAVEHSIAEYAAAELEDEAARAGAIVGAVRTSDIWARHAQAHAIAELPLIRLTYVSSGGLGPVRRWDSGRLLDGIRVLDFTRVLAGPVATRNLALAGADVLRIDSPGLPEIGWQHLETGSGKRSATLDLAAASDRQLFWELLGAADVVVTGYRPGSLDRIGLAASDLHERRPGLVVARVSAWGDVGPWAGRRGFDSIVQAVTGIAMMQSADGATPGALPAQALDHSAGHFLCAAIVRALVQCREAGGGWQVDVALARLAQALLETGATGAPAITDSVTLSSATQSARGAAGDVRIALPPLILPGAPSEYPELATIWGSDDATWR